MSRSLRKSPYVFFIPPLCHDPTPMAESLWQTLDKDNIKDSINQLHQWKHEVQAGAELCQAQLSLKLASLTSLLANCLIA